MPCRFHVQWVECNDSNICTLSTCCTGLLPCILLLNTRAYIREDKQRGARHGIMTRKNEKRKGWLKCYVTGRFDFFESINFIVQLPFAPLDMPNVFSSLFDALKQPQCFVLEFTSQHRRPRSA